MTPARRIAAVILALVQGSLLSSCVLFQLGSNLEELEQVVRFTGSVDEVSEAPILVGLFVHSDQRSSRFELVSSRYLAQAGAYEFLVAPGCYYVGALEDLDRDRDADDGERFIFLREPLCLGPGEEHSDLTLRLTERWGDVELDPLHEVIDSERFRTGDQVGLEHPQFARSEGEHGMWRPMDALKRFPAGLFFLDEYDPLRVPVLFIHGMSGTARDFAAIIERLDRDQYQPWVAQYPSALPLQIVGGRIAKALVELHARYRFPRACVIAHSMGGLVAREVVRTLPSDVPVRGLATIASPLGGVHSATAGVRWSPAVVPSWRDIAPGSPFLRGLYEPSLPRAVPYYLLFAFSEGESSDGVVEIASQLRSEAQEEAEVIRGFAGTHTGVLESEDVQRVLSRFLNRCSISDDGGLGRIGKEED